MARIERENDDVSLGVPVFNKICVSAATTSAVAGERNDPVEDQMWRGVELCTRSSHQSYRIIRSFYC